ncbi:hypothetical protein ACFL2T_04350 [Elusimicrobiota bacterium]
MGVSADEPRKPRRKGVLRGLSPKHAPARPARRKPRGEREVLRSGSGKPDVLLPETDILAVVEKIEDTELREAAFRPRIALVWSFGLAMFGAFIWAGVVYLAGFRIGLIAIVVGLMAGYGAARGGRCRHSQFIGGGCAAAGYFVGQVGALLGLIVAEHGLPLSFGALLPILPAVFMAVLKSTFSSFDAVFLGLAVYEGYRIPAPVQVER